MKVVLADLFGNVVFEDGTIGRVRGITRSDDSLRLIGRERATLILEPLP